MPAIDDKHKAQLHVCHERIEGLRADGKHVKWGCDLSAYAWCYTCDHYVCDIHLNSNHRGEHDSVIEFPGNTTRRGKGLRPGLGE